MIKYAIQWSPKDITDPNFATAQDARQYIDRAFSTGKGHWIWKHLSPTEKKKAQMKHEAATVVPVSVCDECESRMCWSWLN